MKKTLHRYLFSALLCVLAVVFAAGLLTACGGTGSGTGTGSGDPQTGAEHTLSFDAGEGVDIPDIVAKAGETITPPADPVKEGFEFDGWYLGVGGTGEKATLPTVMPDEDVTYYGKWTTLTKITLNAAGGTADVASFYIKAGEDLYAALSSHKPTRDGFKFHAWSLSNEYLTESYPAPAQDTTLVAVWMAPVKSTLKKLNFITYDEYSEGETGNTAYFIVGETISGGDFVPEKYHLNEDLTKPLTVQDSLDNTMEVYCDPDYTCYTDVFESTDLLYELEIEEGVLYLDRIGMEEGRKKSTTYNAETGEFTFKTGSSDTSFVLEGKVSGEKFFYYRDTVNREMNDLLGSAAKLKIESKDSVTYTTASGAEVKGSYTVNAENGRYVFTPESGTAFEFVLVADGNTLYFRLTDGIEGWYAVDALVGGGWSILGFDGFGQVTNLDDEGNEFLLSYTVVDAEKKIVNVSSSLGKAILVDEAQEDIAGHEILGLVKQSDGYEGEYIYSSHGNRIRLTLDGFGGASLNNLTLSTTSTGSYSLEEDEAWLIHGYNSLGIPGIGRYSGVNERLVYIPSTGDKVTLSVSASYDETGAIVYTLALTDSLDVAPGVHKITNSFFYQGTEYVVDKDHDAFLYFYNDETVSLWYGSAVKGYDEPVYDLISIGEWLGWANSFSDDYDAYLTFKDMAGDGSFEFKEEDWSEEPYRFVLWEGDDGSSLALDVFDVLYYYPAEGDPVEVEYEQEDAGLLVFITLTLPASVPQTVPSKFVQYSDYYDSAISDLEPETIYTLEWSEVQELPIGYTDGSEGGDIVLLLTDMDEAEGKLAFLGVTFVDEDTEEYFVEYVLAGSVTTNGGVSTFTASDHIWYDPLDYYDADDIIELFSEFDYKVVSNSFYYYDGYELTLTNGNVTLTTDGFGFATLTTKGTLGSETETVEGGYYIEYDVLLFYYEDEEYEELVYEAFLFELDEQDETKGAFYELDTQDELFDTYGYYYGTSLDEDGLPSTVTIEGLYLNGAGGFIYEYYESYDDYLDYLPPETVTGSYIVVSYGETEGGEAEFWSLMLTFSETDIREATIYSYDYFGDGDTYGFFCIRNKAWQGTYEAVTDDEAALGTLTGGDGYYSDSATFVGEDSDGKFSYTGYMARGYIDASYYNADPVFSESAEGDVVVFFTEDGQKFVFDLHENGKVYYRDKFYGAVAEYKVDGGTTGRYLVLDGHSEATLYDAEGTKVTAGTYAFAPDLDDAYIFTPAEGETGDPFTFSAASTEFGGGILYIYTVYEKGADVLYVNADWSILRLDGFGNGTYIDKYGASYSGEYYEITSGIYCLEVELSTQRFYFELVKETKSFTVLSGEFLVRGSTLYAYFGSAESIEIPENVTTIAPRAFAQDGARNIKHIDFNKVTTISDNALLAMHALEEVDSESILTVGANAFASIQSLTRVNLPNATTIGEGAFRGCVNLASVTLGKVTSIGAYAFTRSIANASNVQPLVLDLSKVDLEKLTLDFTAFLAERGYLGLVNETVFIEGSKILVSGGVEGLNKAITKLKGQTASISYHDMDDGQDKEGKVTVDLTDLIELAAAEDDLDVAFYDLKSDSVLYLYDGTATVYTKDYDYEERASWSYYVDGTTVTVYKYDTEKNQYAVVVSFASTADSVELDGTTYLGKGKESTTTATVDGKSVVITYNASSIYVLSAYYISVTLDVTKVTFDSHEIEEFTFEDDVLEFNYNDHGYKATLENGSFNVVDLGAQYVVEATAGTVSFRLTLGVAEGKATLTKLSYKTSADGAWSSPIETGFTETADNTWSFTLNKAVYTLKATLTSAAPTATATLEYYVMEAGSYKLTFTMKEGLKAFESITKIEQGSTVLDIQGLTYSEDCTSATLTTEDGVIHVFKIAESRYAPFFEITETQANYDEEAYDFFIEGDDFYMITVTVHVDENGDLSITELKTIQDFNNNYADIPYTSATANNDGTMTIKLADGRTIKATASYGYGIEVSFELEKQA